LTLNGLAGFDSTVIGGFDLDCWGKTRLVRGCPPLRQEKPRTLSLDIRWSSCGGPGRVPPHALWSGRGMQICVCRSGLTTSFRSAMFRTEEVRLKWTRI